MSARGEILPEVQDYWLFDSSDLWVMEYGDDGAFLSIEQVSEPDGRRARHVRKLKKKLIDIAARTLEVAPRTSN
jgi:hypothetical protein